MLLRDGGAHLQSAAGMVMNVGYTLSTCTIHDIIFKVESEGIFSIGEHVSWMLRIIYIMLRLNHWIVLVHVQKTRSISDRASKDTWTVSTSYPPLRTTVYSDRNHGVDICRLATVCNSSWDCKVAIQLSASCRLFVSGKKGT